MVTMLTGCRGTDRKVSAIELKIEELRAGLAPKNAQHALEKAMLGGSRDTGSPSEWTADELSAQLAQGRVEITYENAKLRRIGKLEEGTNVFGVFISSWALRTPQDEESGNAVEGAETTPVVQKPLRVPTATDDTTGLRKTAVPASENLSVEAGNVQLSVAEAAQGSVESSTAPCTDIESAADAEEPLVDKLVQRSSEAVESMVISEEGEVAQASCDGSETARLIVELACAKRECAGGPQRLARSSIPTGPRTRKATKGVTAQVR